MNDAAWAGVMNNTERNTEPEVARRESNCLSTFSVEKTFFMSHTKKVNGKSFAPNSPTCTTEEVKTTTRTERFETCEESSHLKWKEKEEGIHSRD